MRFNDLAKLVAKQGNVKGAVQAKRVLRDLREILRENGEEAIKAFVYERRVRKKRRRKRRKKYAN
jgi:hypothetical protein